MNLGTIHHVAILVRDYDKSRRFYVDQLGFKVVRENVRPDRGDVKLDLELNGLELEIFSASDDAPPRPTYPEALGLRHLAFRVESVEKTAAELNALGIKTERIRIDEFSKKPFTFFHDPDGLPLELHE